MTSTNGHDLPPPPLRAGVVLHVDEDGCDVWLEQSRLRARYAPQFPRPRQERISPGNLVALATAPDGGSVVLWRWYDVVVVAHESSGAVRIWEPAHGEVLATPRLPQAAPAPGSRIYASAGLPGAEWWAAGGAGVSPEAAVVELDAVSALYSENDLWDAALASQT